MSVGSKSVALRAATVALAIIAALVGYAIVEISYRVIQYRDLERWLYDEIRSQSPALGSERSIFDPHTGYRYKPNLHINRSDRGFPIAYRTNSHGLIAREEFPVEKPKGEYRIGLIGDSFTANVTNTVRWGDILEDELNASPQWRHRVDGRHTRVVNFGLDGIGNVQFGAVAEHIAKPFGIDLMIVNMIRNDLLRRPIYRGRSALTDDQLRKWTRSYVTQLPWWSPHLEVLAVIARGQGRLTAGHLVDATMKHRFYDTAEQAVERSVAAARVVRTLYPTSIWLLHPMWEEYVGQLGVNGTDRMEIDALALFRKQMPSLHLVEMIEQVRKPTSRAEADGWFNVPFDRHNNDLGLTIYGRAVTRFLIERARSD